MAKPKEQNENIKTFEDFQTKAWFHDGKTIKVADNPSKFISNEYDTIEVKEILHGVPYKTFRIVISNEDKIYLLKTSRQFK